MTPSPLDDVLAEIAQTLRDRRAKRDTMPPGPDREAMERRITRMQNGYDALVKCFHRECQ